MALTDRLPVGARFTGPADPLLAASTRVINSIAAVLRGYGISDAEMDHAIRTLRCILHGFAVLQAADGFQWSGDPGQTVDWMIRFLDRGLRPDGPRGHEHHDGDLARPGPRPGSRPLGGGP